MLAGCAFLPLDPSWPLDRIAFILEDASCRHVVLHECHRRLLPSSFTGVVIKMDDAEGRRIEHRKLWSLVDAARSLMCAKWNEVTQN